jgi:Flp pilus assembly pilin Flp
MLKSLKRLWKEDEAANAVEYGLITAVIAVALIGVLFVFRQQITNLFTKSGQQVNGAN